ncbi:MAG: hypothetical protein BYD32DRAFT_459061 [Podila humilis]|nr:MAG: hypothetical protein BYD32DRAFT_459061 [Podila humilis]
MTDNRLSLFCLVDGGSASNVFPVKLSPDDFIGDLKKLIKVEKTNNLSDVDADKLTLWHVSIPITDDDDEVPILLNDVTRDKKKKLGPAIEISEVFEVQPPKKTIHIIIHCGNQKTDYNQSFPQCLENGASPLEKEVDPIRAIGIQMLLQLLPEKRLHDVMQDYEELHPMHILALVAKDACQDLREATVILVVDGLQSFMIDPKDGLNKEPAFYRALTNIGILLLPVASLEPPCTFQNGSSVLVFDEDDHIIKVLVSNCGGHGRALESLQQVIGATSEDYNVESLMNSLHLKLKDLYSEAVSSLPGQLAIPGLIRYEQPNGLGTGGYLTTPYIWVWLFSYQPREDADPLLFNWQFCDYPDLKSKMDPRLPPGAQFWQHFEHFVVTFHCLKSRVLEDHKPTTISAIHTGARLHGDINFTNHHLKLAISSQHVDTKSTSHQPHSTIRCEHETLSVHKGEHCIINAPSAPYGDSFIGLDARSFCTEVHQCKLIANGQGIDYHTERKKAASNRDFFMLFTSKDRLDVELPPHSGVVDGSNWKLYFGPFAGRVFVFATTGALDINLVPLKYLKQMRGVDERKAGLIIQERDKRRFDSLEDATQRLHGVGKTVLKRFKFPRTA